MPLFKRRNAVKAKHVKNISQQSSISDGTVISEVNSMLNELVGAVSEQTDSVLKNDGQTNDIPRNSVSKPLDSVLDNDAYSVLVTTNTTSHQNDASQENSECFNSISRDNISKQQDSSEKNPISEHVVQNSTKKADSTEKNDECTGEIKTNNISEHSNSSQGKDIFTNSEIQENVTQQVESVQKSDESLNAVHINDISNKTNSLQKNDEPENLRTNHILNQTNLAETNNDDKITLSMYNVSKETDSVHENGECTTTSSIPNIIKQEIDDSSVIKNNSQENNSAHQKKLSMKKTRSSSESESNIASQAKYSRRKFGSEAEIMSICQKILPPEQQKGINEAVVKYIDNLIKKSILEAVKNINVDNLCEELTKDASNSKSSQDNESDEDFVVEQRLSSKSISELVELQNVENKYENGGNHLLLEYDGKVSETESLENETDDNNDCASFRGYLADLDDTASVDDIKSAGEDSLCNSSCSGFEKLKSNSCNSESSGNITELKPTEKRIDDDIDKTIADDKRTVNDEPKLRDISAREQNIPKQEKIIAEASNYVDENEKTHTSNEKSDHISQTTQENNSISEQDKKRPSNEATCENDETLPSSENVCETDKNIFLFESIHRTGLKAMSAENSEISLKSLDEEMEKDVLVKRGSLPNPNNFDEERTKVNWKVGNIHIKLPHKSRGKTSLKAWKKRRVVIQPDEFVNDPTNQSLVISVYGAKKHETTFWYSVSSQKAVVFRSSSHTHRYAFTISEGGQAIIHLSAENESETQEWMAAIRAVLWPPSPFMELEKMLSGQEFEVSIIDNEFSYHAGLLGMYGYLSITPKKLILLHPQQGYVIQEWYLNTVDKFQFVLQQKQEDMHKVLCMTTCKDSSTGQGDIIFFCKEAVTLLQALASNIHQVLSYHSKQEGGKYQKELEELAEWMLAPPQDCLNAENDEHYKVPPRQVKSLLDIPNFIFNKSLSPVASAIYPAPNTEVMETLNGAKNKLTNTSQDSGISTCTSSDDFLNCSTAFVIGGGPMTGKSSDSELSDAYSPPRTPEMTKKKMLPEVDREETLTIEK